MLGSIKLFAILYFIIISFVYALQRKRAMPVIVPGDIYIPKGQGHIYIPLGLTTILTLISFLIIKNLAEKFGVEF